MEWSLFMLYCQATPVHTVENNLNANDKVRCVKVNPTYSWKSEVVWLIRNLRRQIVHSNCLYGPFESVQAIRTVTKERASTCKQMRQISGPIWSNIFLYASNISLSQTDSLTSLYNCQVQP